MKKTTSLIVALVIILLGGVIFHNLRPSQSASNTKMMNYVNNKFGFSFKYPKEYGHVISSGAKKLPVDFTPEADGMKTFANYASVVGLRNEYDEKFTFSNLQKPEQYSSTTPVITEIYVVDLNNQTSKNIVASPINNKNISLQEEGKLLESKPDGFLEKQDTGYYLKKYTTENGLIVVTNDGVGSLGTSFEKMYQVYGKNKVLEINITYVPFAYTPESVEQEQYIKDKRGNDYWRAHQDYLQTGKTSQKLRDAFANAEQIVDSLVIN